MYKNKIVPVLAFLFSVALLFSCNAPSKRYENPKYGGTLHVNLSGAPDNIFPGLVIKNSEQVIVTQVYDGLVKYHPRTLDIIPSIAKKWLTEREGTIYTFFLNTNATFHNDQCFPNGKGRQIVAADFKYSLEQICRNYINSNTQLSKQLTNIKGFEAFLEAEKNNDTADISGITIYNDTTLVFRLNKPDKMFIHLLAGTNGLVFAREAFEAYGTENTVGSGAFLLENPNNKAISVLLTFNPDYYQTNRQNEHLPFIDSIRFSFISSTQQELALFKKNKLNMVLNLTHKYVTPFLDENIDAFQSNPPFYVMKQTADYSNNLRFHVLRSNVKGLDINSQSFYDFSETYFENPKPQEIEIIN